MAQAPGWRAVMNEDVMAKLDVLIGMVQGLQADNRSLNESMNAQGERIARMEGRLDEQSRILVALIPTQLAAVPRPAA
jgi:hypothetical protein